MKRKSRPPITRRSLVQIQLPQPKINRSEAMFIDMTSSFVIPNIIAGAVVLLVCLALLDSLDVGAPGALPGKGPAEPSCVFIRQVVRATVLPHLTAATRLCCGVHRW